VANILEGVEQVQILLVHFYQLFCSTIKTLRVRANNYKLVMMHLVPVTTTIDQTSIYS